MTDLDPQINRRRGQAPVDEPTTPSQGITEALEQGAYGFIDLGSGDGGSIEYCKRVFARGEGLGIEINEQKVERSRGRSATVLHGDIRDLQLPGKCVSFCSMLDLLEYVPEPHVTRVLLSATHVARDFLFVRRPNFDASEYLSRFGLRFAWSDWSGIKHQMPNRELQAIATALRIGEVLVVPRRFVLDSEEPSLVPASAPRDTVSYDRSKHGPKPYAVFDRPVPSQFDILVRLNSSIPARDWRGIVKSVLLDSVVS